MIYLAYDDKGMADGLGAQIQRIYTIYAIGRRFRISTRNLRVSDVLLHHQDGIKNYEEYEDLLKRTNSFLEARLGKNNECPNPIQVPLLTTRILLKYLIKYGWRFKKFTLVTNNPYPIVNRFKSVFNRLNSQKNSEVKKMTIHLRSAGNKPNFLVKNENKTRNIELRRYLEVVETISQEFNEFTGIQICVMTDAVETVNYFSIPLGQEQLWIDAGYEIAEGKIKFEPNNEMESALRYLKNTFNAEIIRGGDPLSCFQRLIDSDILIMSRSSLSYAAGLMGNHSTVFTPRDFWHLPIKNWKTF